MRLFVFARHAESAANVAHVISSDPARPAALTRRGRLQARKLGAQLANLEIDGASIQAYWAWKEQHAPSERFPHGESLDEAVGRYADALRRLLARTEAVTLIVAHELGLRYIATAAAGTASAALAPTSVANAVPYLFDEPSVRRALDCLDALTPSTPRRLSRAEAA